MIQFIKADNGITDMPDLWSGIIFGKNHFPVDKRYIQYNTRCFMKIIIKKPLRYACM